MRPGLRIGVALAGAASLLMACQLLVGVKDEDENLRPVASVEAGTVDAAASDADPCMHAGPPPAPLTGPDKPESSHYFAVRAIRLGGYDELPKAYDFDNTCTCENRHPAASVHTSCRTAQEPCGTPPNDDSEGRDLGGARAFERTVLSEAIIGPVERNDVNSRFEEGVLGILLGIDGYNETGNDTKVQVSFSLSNGIEKVNDAGPVRTEMEACNGGNDSGVIPRWAADKSDVWFGPRSGFQRRDGYVTDGRLVVSNAGLTYSLPVGGQLITLKDPIFVGRLTRTVAGSGSTLKGNLVGIVNANSLLGVIGSFIAPGATDGGRLCNSGIFEGFAFPICGARDLSQDSTDKNAPCDSFSLAVGIEAYEVSVGGGTSCAPVPAVSCDKKCAPIP